MPRLLTFCSRQDKVKGLDTEVARFHREFGIDRHPRWGHNSPHLQLKLSIMMD